MVRICAVQMNVVHNDVPKNHKKAKNYVVQAGDKECDFLVFPEIFLEGVIRDINSLNKLARPIPGEYTDWFTKYAEEYGMHIVMGSIHEKTVEDFYNTSVLIDDKGNIIGKYRKNFLWASENKFLKPSKERPVFDTKFGKVGINICWDFAFPEVANTMARKGAKILFGPSFWSLEDKYGMAKNTSTLEKLSNVEPEPQFVDTLVSARAYENEMLVVYVNPYGKYNLGNYEINLFGHTQLAMPFFGTFAKMHDDEGMLVVDANTEWLDMAEEVYAIRKTYND